MNGSPGAVTSTCQRCGASQDGPSGHCRRCGGVALYTHPWSGRPDTAAPATPLFASRTPGLEGVLLKVEGANLSGSFKDRVMPVLAAEAVHAGSAGAVVASSGNAAVAAASACARAGLPLLVLVPDAVATSAVTMVQLRGGVVVRAGDGPAAVHGLAARLGREFGGESGLANLASTFGSAGCEWGCRGIGHEIAGQLPDRAVSELAASISVGPVLLGAAHGLTEAGREMPALIGGQAAGCAPIVAAWDQGADEVVPWTAPADTAALAIADRVTGYAHEATYALQQIRASGGAVAAVSDADMASMRRALARHDGIDVELASAAAAVVLCHRRAAGVRNGDGATVLVLTGAGMKETLAGAAGEPSTDAVQQFATETGAGPALVEAVEEWVRSSRP